MTTKPKLRRLVYAAIVATKDGRLFSRDYKAGEAIDPKDWNGFPRHRVQQLFDAGAVALQQHEVEFG